ncbi:nuclear pore protein 84/107 [Ganoderma leucocontextum]|nr:nuclear pore protein 84/107 [Ganoderma leucocontextum]
MAESLYASCASVLSLCQANKDDLETLLHPETGFAPRLREICNQQLAELQEAAAAGSVSSSELDALKMESNTWALLQALMSLRKTTPPEYPHPRDLLAANPYTPPATLAQSIMHASPLLSALVVVREWLHDSAPLPATPGATNGYWRFTRNAVLQGKRTGRIAGGVVAELDPDAVNRGGEEGKGLAPDDAAYDKAILQALYAHVRAGQLEEAVELCRKANQPWRAASIRGAFLFQWRAIANEPRDEDAMDDEDTEDSQQWHGNVRRQMWKTVCHRTALNTTLSPTERALYAALAPTPSTSAVLKAVCRTWEDHLWALVGIACEERLSLGLASIARECFWESGLGALEGGASGAADGVVPLNSDEDEEWEDDVMKMLEGLSGVQVAEGAPADHPYHVSQLHIILDRTDELLEAFANGLQEGLYVSAPEYPAMTRFFAHLCLFLQLIDTQVSLFATQIILEAYLRVLEHAGQRELIAMYAGALGDNAVERYALFLTSLELAGDATERRLALTRAREHGLDIERVAIVTAERTIEKTFTILPPAKGPLPSIIGLEPAPTDAEILLLRSIEWTTFLESTYDTALEQANVILRYFLGRGRIQLSKTLLDMLPPELGSLTEPEDQATEYMHYRQFFNVWELLARVVETQVLEQPQMNKDTRAAWLSDYKTLIEQAREQVVKLLTTDWLMLDVDVPNGDRRRRDLIRIRQTYIPELIIRLHSILVGSRSRIPENIKYTLSLVNVVADSRYRLYDDFSSQDGRRLGDYLGAVRQAVLAGLEGGGSDPFRILTL